jgi:PPOX class probable F420-dependent enzyme
MDIAQAKEFLTNNHRAVMATRRADGKVQMSPVAAGVDDDGRVMVSTRQSAMKTKNLRRDPWTSLCVMNDNFFGSWIRVDGRAAIVELPDAMELLVDYYRRTGGEHPDWAEYRAAMEQENRVMLLVTIDEVGPNRSG